MKKHVWMIVVLMMSVFFHAMAVSASDDSSPSRKKRSSPRIDKVAGEQEQDLTLQPCDELIEDAAITSGTDDVYKFNQSSQFWGVIGLRPDPGSDWDISLYSDSCGTGTELGGSWSYGDSTEFVVADYNPSHCPGGWEGVWIGLWDGTGNARVEYENGEDSLIVGNNEGIDWPADDVVEIWDLLLSPDDYTIALDITAGTADLGIAIFQSSDSCYYIGRYGTAAASDYAGGGGDESFTFTAPMTDYYGVVVWSNDANAATFSISVGTTGIGDGKGVGTALPMAFALNQNYPNPFNPSTIISYQMPERANVTLKIHDIRGRVVRELVNGFEEAGSHSVQWNGKGAHGQGVPSGIYFYVLDTDQGYRSTRKMVILK